LLLLFCCSCCASCRLSSSSFFFFFLFLLSSSLWDESRLLIHVSLFFFSGIFSALGKMKLKSKFNRTVR